MVLPKSLRLLSKSQPNLKAVLVLSLSFFVLFTAFFSASNAATKALKSCGFEDLAFQSLTTLYFFFGLSCFWAPKLIVKLGAKLSMALASLTYASWIVSLALTSLALKSDSLHDMLSRETVYVIVMAVSVVSGTGGSFLWIGQGKYLSDCAMICLERKGQYTSLFWTTMLTAQVVSSFFNAFVLGTLPQEYLFIMGTIITLVATVILSFLPKLVLPGE